MGVLDEEGSGMDTPPEQRKTWGHPAGIGLVVRSREMWGVGWGGSLGGDSSRKGHRQDTGATPRPRFAGRDHTPLAESFTVAETCVKGDGSVTG